MRTADDPNGPIQIVASALRELRALAGQPSLDQLVRLTKQQGPRWAMPRSTINDKLNGTTAPKAEQVLALVRAFRDYAAAAGNPLPSEFCEEGRWHSEWLGMKQALADPQSHNYCGTVAQEILAARQGPAEGTAPSAAPAEPSKTTRLEDLMRTVGPETLGRELPPKHAAALAKMLRTAGRTVELDQLLTAASARSAQAVLTLSEDAGLEIGGRLLRLVLKDTSITRMAALVKEAEHHHPEEAVGLIHLGVQHRPVPEVVSLIETLHSDGGSPFIGEILSAVLRGRSAPRVSEFLSRLRAAGLRDDADVLLYFIGLSHDEGWLLEVITRLKERRRYADARRLRAVIEPRWWRRPPTPV
ncbi:hypothetical protein [Streptomyces roseifaciens]|uniref:hypothetical protein n=1 Tax=Streptomyces roseifaciens TaxID=1488406 RepID=UPI000AD00145|nr:hypothetical protein [Streptomyces roseifaciens]